MRVIAENFTDKSILTSDIENSNVKNLKYYSRSSTFNTTAFNDSLPTQSIFMRLNGSEAVSAVILGRHDFPTGLEFQIFFYSDYEFNDEIDRSDLLIIGEEEAGSDIIPWEDFLWGTVVWAEDSLSEDLVLKSNYVYWLDSTIVIRSMKIVIHITDRDVEIGRLIVGKHIEPTYTISYGHNIEWIENTKQFRKNGNTLRSNIATPSRKLTFDLKTINETDRILLQKAFRHVGLRKDLFISLFPNDIDKNKIKLYSGIVKLTKIPSILEYAPMYYNSKYEVEEV